MPFKYFWLLVALLVVQPVWGSSYGDGFVKLDAIGGRLFTTDLLTKKDEVLIQYPSTSGRAKCCIAVLTDGDPRSQTEVSDELNQAVVYSYRLIGLRKKDSDSPFLGMAMRSKRAQVRQLFDSEIIVMAGKHRSSLRTCLASEGIHLMRTAAGKLKSHLYMHFDYGVSPTCNAKTAELLRN